MCNNEMALTAWGLRLTPPDEHWPRLCKSRGNTRQHTIAFEPRADASQGRGRMVVRALSRRTATSHCREWEQ